MASKEPTFEEQLTKLQAIVNQLEQSNVPLASAIE